jgi:hypothetical protein
MKNYFIFVLLIFLSACSNKSDTSEKPWMGYAFSKKDNRAEFFFSSHDSNEACIEDMNWETSNTINANWYSKPIGCAFYSNSFVKAAFYYYLSKTNSVECFYESYDPAIRKIKGKYGPLLKGYKKRDPSEGKCVLY